MLIELRIDWWVMVWFWWFSIWIDCVGGSVLDGLGLCVGRCWGWCWCRWGGWVFDIRL